jgi:hypothetical protein
VTGGLAGYLSTIAPDVTDVNFHNVEGFPEIFNGTIPFLDVSPIVRSHTYSLCVVLHKNLNPVPCSLHRSRFSRIMGWPTISKASLSDGLVLNRSGPTGHTISGVRTFIVVWRLTRRFTIRFRTAQDRKTVNEKQSLILHYTYCQVSDITNKAKRTCEIRRDSDGVPNPEDVKKCQSEFLLPSDRDAFEIAISNDQKKIESYFKGKFMAPSHPADVTRLEQSDHVHRLRMPNKTVGQMKTRATSIVAHTNFLCAGA